MGNSIKRQFLTAAVISAFALASAGVASAGVRTVLDGSFKGKIWCGVVGTQMLPTGEAVKEKVDTDFTMAWDFSLFPEITATITEGTLIFDMVGVAVRKNEKNGFFTLIGTETSEPANFSQVSMNGKYKTDKKQVINNVPTKINGKFFTQSLSPGNFGDPLAEVCVGQTGNFSAKGNGIVIP